MATLNHNRQQHRQFEKQTCRLMRRRRYRGCDQTAARSMASAQIRHHDVWGSGEAYERYVGRWSRQVAREFVDWLALPTEGRWLDIGCGTGALTQAILARATPASVAGIGPSDQFIGHAREHIVESRARFRAGSAEILPFADRLFDAVVSGLVLNFVTSPERAVAEMRRVLRPGGTGAVYVWDHAGEMQLIRRFWDAAISLDPDARDIDEGRRFPICHPEPLLTLFRKAGF